MTMKFIAPAAAAFFAFAAPAWALDAGEVRRAYAADAFADADADWRRLTANRISECGRYGREKNLRINVIVDRYNAIGEALASGDDNAVEAATTAFAATANANKRFETCWTKIARRAGVSREFRKMVRDL